MTYLLYYANERKVFLNEFSINLTVKEANSIIKKLIKHYKLHAYNDWRFVGATSSRCITHFMPKSQYFIRKPYGYFKFSREHTSIGVICHELAHAIETIKYGKSAHAKKHFNIMKRLIKYCNKMGYVPKKDIIVVSTGQERQGMSCMALQIAQYIKELPK